MTEFFSAQLPNADINGLLIMLCFAAGWENMLKARWFFFAMIVYIYFELYQANGGW